MSSTPRAKRRSSSREIPWPPKQMWYCSVSLEWKRSRGSLVDRGLGRAVAVGHAGGRGAARERRRSPRARRGPRRRRRCSAPCSGRRGRPRSRRAGRPRSPSPRRARACRADGRRRRPRRGRRGPGPAARPRTSRSPRARPRARGRSRAGQRRAEQHLRHQVERVRGVLVEESRVQVRGLLRGRGVGRRAHAVEELGDLDRRVALGPLEQQVLEEVREAGLAGAPRPASRSSPRGRGRPSAPRGRPR